MYNTLSFLLDATLWKIFYHRVRSYTLAQSLSQSYFYILFFFCCYGKILLQHEVTTFKAELRHVALKDNRLVHSIAKLASQSVWLKVECAGMITSNSELMLQKNLLYVTIGNKKATCHLFATSTSAVSPFPSTVKGTFSYDLHTCR